MARHRRKPPPAGEFFADVSDLAEDGRGVARIDGKVLFVADALPGERVRFRYTRMSREMDEGQTLGVEQPSPDRVTPLCKHFGVCGGCALQHLAPQAQIRYKQKQLIEALARIGKVTPDVVAEPLTGPIWGYRRRARLGAKYVTRHNTALVGFRERESSFLAALESCVVLDPRVGEKLRDLGKLIAGLTIRSQLPQIEVATSAETVALVLRVMSPPDAQDLEQLHAFAREHDVDLYLQPGGPDTVAALGVPRELSYAPLQEPDRLHFRPTDFIQVNAELSRKAVAQAMDWLAPQPGEHVLELFSGLGNFSIPLARAGARVHAVEGEDALVQRARDNAQRLGLEIEFSRANLFEPQAEAPWAHAQYDAVLLDPPRAGAQEILPLLGKLRAPRLLYVSCHPGTLARDAGLLVREHGYRLVRAGVMDMFPHTAHVESMALFERV
ncbi:MAG: rlmD [Hydrocarboniphaga sp.]|uniref:23S rRNA (uracil(1939)-C(5))-methyltransferase RlmD n=1 Tax=Hydrocarboniphaga sp. TaxID=2033016 RepID=UPI002609481D|nr:23S rRNA (uracil(1939)-C(5))-methyltransferase RlmD [Hydrocarboniphaga sp.]MDB5967906.1 rlmD [Hydrocarboniphaga sp.]